MEAEMFFLFGGGLLVIIFGVVASVVSTFVSTIASVEDDSME